MAGLLLVNGKGRSMGGKSLMREHFVLASVFSPVLGREKSLRKLCDLRSRRSHRLRSMRFEPLELRTLLSAGGPLQPGDALLAAGAFIGPMQTAGQLGELGLSESGYAASDAYRQKLFGSTTDAYDRFGYAVDVSGDVAIIGAQEDENARSLTGAAFVYRFNGTKWIEEQKLYDPNGEIGDRLGNAVAIEGNLAVVCAEQDDNAKGQDAGSAFVFRYNGASWVLEKQLIASDGKAFDRFGCSVAIDGDRIVVGAREKDGIGANSGGAYVFRYSGSQWVEEAALQASDMASLDEFGSAVDIDGNTIMVGAQKDPVNLWNSGSVYVYRFNGTSWVETQRFFPQPAVDLAYFGASLSLDGDTVVVGASQDDDYVISNGAVHVFHFNGSNWVESEKLFAPDPKRDAMFGQSVSLDGDTLVVGAPSNVLRRGSAYVFKKMGDQWAPTRKVVGDAPEDSDLFGCSVSISGSRVFVGSYYDSQLAPIAGAAYVFDANDPQTIAIRRADAKLFGSQTDGYDEFGSAVAVRGNRAIVGARGDEQGTLSTGAAYVYRNPGSGWAEEQRLVAPSGAASDLFGSAVAIEGNVAVVCAEGDDNAKGQDAGSAFVFRNNGTAWVLEQQLLASDGKASDRFGCSVAIAGDRIVVGAREKDGIGANSGGAYVFRYSGSQWVEEAALQASDMASLDEFGSAVAIDGNTIMVGAQKDPIGGGSSGSVYVYHYTGTSWAEAQRFYPQAGDDLAYFGNSIALDGQYAIVGARETDDVILGNGTAHVFRYNGSQWVEHQRLHASDPDYFAYFGAGVSLSGGLAAVGAEGDQYGTGAVYLYALEGDKWVEQCKYIGDDPLPWDRLGAAVSLSGTSLWAGAWGSNERGLSNAGSAYVIDLGPPASIIVTPTSGLTTAEAGGMDFFTVVLNKQPTADVTIPLSSSDQSEGMVSPAILTFTAANWATPRLVTVTGVDDFGDDGNVAYTIRTEPAVSGDAEYNGLDAADVTVVNLDDDESGGVGRLFAARAGQGIVEIDPVSGAVLSVFAAPKTQGVSDGLAFDGKSLWYLAGSFDKNTLYQLNPNNGAVIRTFPLPANGFRDGLTALNGLVYITHWSAVEQDIVAFDPDTGKIVQTLDINGLNPGVFFSGGLGSLTGPDTLLVTGADNALIYEIDPATGHLVGSFMQTEALGDLGVAGWGGEIYVGRNTSNVIIVYDRGGRELRRISVSGSLGIQALAGGIVQPGVEVHSRFGLTTTEAGGTASFTVALRTQPTDNVTIPLVSSDTTEGVVSPTSVTFTPANWAVPQTVTVNGVDDSGDDGSLAYKVLTAPAISADPRYNGLDGPDAFLTNLDDEVSGSAGRLFASSTGRGILEINPASGAILNELAAPVNLGVNDGLAFDGVSLWFLGGSFDPNTLYQLNPNTGAVIKSYPLPKNGFRDGLTALNGRIYITHYGAGENDIIAFDPTTGTVVQTLDIDGLNPGVDFGGGLGSLTDSDVLLVTGAGDNLIYKIDPFTGLVLGSFTQNQGGADDGLAGWDGEIYIGRHIGNEVFVYNRSGVQVRSITIPGISGMQSLGGGALRSGITVSPTSRLTTTEAGGKATFTVVLESAPSANVTIPVSSNNLNEGVASPGSLTFTPANWSTPQTVTVTGVNDDVDDGDAPYTIILGEATTADPTYAGFDPADVSVTNADNDTAGITVVPISPLVTTEAGGTARFTVVLDSRPAASVTIAFASSDTAEGSVSPGNLVFTADNWNTPQTVTVSGVDDFIDDGDAAYTIAVGPVTSSDAKYAAVSHPGVAVTNIDNDTAGITVAPISGLVTTEAGGAAEFTIVLDSQPTGNVTVVVLSSNVNEGTVSHGSVTFSTANWNVPQKVTVTGVDDPVDDGDAVYTILVGPVVTGDPKFAGLNPADVSVTNIDDDTAGIVVAPPFGLTTTEAGGKAQFTVVLASAPVSDVAVAVSSANTAEGVVSAASLTFTTANWSTPQTVTVTGVNDFVDDGDVPYAIVVGPVTSSDAKYAAIGTKEVWATNTDDDTAGITVTPTSGLVTTEAGGKATFTVVLNSQPTGNVLIAVSSSDTTECAVSPAALSFTPTNWNMPKMVTVTGVDDFADDGDRTCTIVLGPATSSDPEYAGMDPADVSVTNIDNDAIGITVNPTSGLATTEGGGKATFTVVLNSLPAADVSLAITSINPGEGIVSPAALTFTSTNWNLVQTVTVTGVDDPVDDGDVTYTIRIEAAASADPDYAGLEPTDVSVVNTDDDMAGITVSPTSGLVTTEAGGTATFTVVLDTQPAAGVTISLSSSDASEGTVSPSSLAFTSDNWNIPQTVTVTGVDDLADDGEVGYAIHVGPVTSGDEKYAGVDQADVSVTNTDNDVAGITVSPTSGLVTTEAGGTATFTVVLDTQPAASVTISLSSSDVSEGTVSPASLAFDSANWNIPQTVTVSGVDDQADDGEVGYTIHVGPVAGSDGKYAAIDPADVSVINFDNDTAGVTIQWQTERRTTEAGGTAAFTVVLDTQPIGAVTIAVQSGNTAEGTVSPALLTFTPQNWSSAQQVTVTGVDDDLDDGDAAYQVTVGPPGGGDPIYAALPAQQFSLANADDDEGLVVVDLGAVDFRRLEGLNPGAGELWYRLETSHAGWLTIQSAAAWTSEQLAIGIYAPEDTAAPLAVSNPVDATPRIDYAVEQGQTYLVKVSGSASGVELWLANLVHVVGGSLTAHGTPQDDDFHFDAGASCTITVNGVVYKFDDGEVATFQFDAGEGFDVVWLYDSPGDDTLEAWPDRVVMSHAAGGAAAAYSVEASGFEDLQSYSARGGVDAAILHGSSGSDKLKSYEDFVRLRAKNTVYSLRAKKFAAIVCDPGSGGSDAAVFDGTDGNETFTYHGVDNSARMQGKRRDHLAVGFGSVIVRAGGGEGDVAYFTDLPGTDSEVDDIFYFKSHKTELVKAGVTVTARAFDEVHATASESGFDVARIYDTTKDDHFECEGGTARLFRKLGTQLDLLYEVIAFERVKVYGSGGNDTKDVRDHTFELFFTDFGEP
jgi:glutamine cyclotransferase